MIDDSESFALTQTLTGRLRNFPLSPSPDNALWGVYEAVANSLHTIRDARMVAGQARVVDGQGRITITVHRDADGAVNGFEISDNGIGLNSENFESFRKVDSTFKAVRGGKGVGRLTWLKTFNRVHVSSSFLDDGEIKTRQFDFIEDDERPIRNHSIHLSSPPVQTNVTLGDMKEAYKRECPRRPETLVRSVIRHFLKDLITKGGAEIIVSDDGISDLHSVFAASIERRLEDVFSATLNGEAHEFGITHLVVSKAFADHEAKENAMYLLAHGRVVATQTVGGLIGLKKLQGGRTYVGLIEGEFLDNAVTQERTMLTTNSTVIDEIIRYAADEATVLPKRGYPTSSRQTINDD